MHLERSKAGAEGKNLNLEKLAGFLSLYLIKLDNLENRRTGCFEGMPQ